MSSCIKPDSGVKRFPSGNQEEYEDSNESVDGTNQHEIEASNSSNLKLLSWNIDGLDSENLEERTDAVVATILSKKPDVVMLQEVVEYSLGVLRNKCVGYSVLVGPCNFPYFNAILIRSSSTDENSSELDYLPFGGSGQGRHFLVYAIRFAETDIVLMTSHLESLRDCSATRKTQFKEIILYMRRRSNDVNVIFGGDTNLRDKEVCSVGGLPKDVLDVWVNCGSPEDAEFTWDMGANDNKAMSGAKPKLRFDRLFLRQAQHGKIVKPSTISLIGKERLKCGRFASDHWGIWSEFEI